MTSGNYFKQWSVADFERDRQHLCEFMKGPISAIENGLRRILIRAPVKSGKRQMVEYLAMRDNTSHPTRKHKLLTQWHRRADEDQRDELNCYGIEVLSGITCKKKEDYNFKISETLRIDLSVTLIIHIDECDHGSGIRQAMSEIWRKWRENSRIIFILYSATPEEVIYSGEIPDNNDPLETIDNDRVSIIEEIEEGARFDYKPPPTFCGPAKFLDEGLVFESRPFFENVPSSQNKFRLSDQGKAIVVELISNIENNSRRNIVLLRLSYSNVGNEKSNSKENKAIYQFMKNLHMFPELNNFLIYVDKDEKLKGIHPRVISEKIQWSNSEYWRGKAVGIPTLIVLDQTFSRSTEPACHHCTFALHDYRNQINFSVSSQAVERMNHYTTKYPSGFQSIRVYCYYKTFLLSAGRISYEEFLHTEWIMKKIQQRGNRQPHPIQEMFKIHKNDNTHEIHPDYPNPMYESEAKVILMNLGCEKRPSTLSTRVKGSIDEKVKIMVKFVPCASSVEFERLKQEGQLNGYKGSLNNYMESPPANNLFENNRYIPDPEELDRRFKSNIRGVYKSRTRDEVERERWGINQYTLTRRHICYDEHGECGILIQMFDGYIEVDCLTAYGSMYVPRVSS
jgi:hypothetical protein